MTTDRWLAPAATRPPAPRTRVYCFPHAGAGATLFRAWQPAFPADVEVAPVQLPGRERRFAEEPLIDVPELAAAIAADADRPFAFYGHSLGGLLAFEVTRALRDGGHPLPVSLHVGGSRAPHLRAAGPLDGLSRLPDDELVARLASAGGTDPAVLAEPDLVELLLPVLRADFAWLDDYRFADAEPLPVPVVSWCGEDDHAISAEESQGWARHTSAGARTVRLRGGHFFLHDHVTTLADAIGHDLSGVPANPRTTVI